MSTETNAVPRLKALYNSRIRAELKEQLGLSNIMEVPRFEKIVINVGCGGALENRHLIDKVTNRTLSTVYRVILLIPAVIPSTLVFVLWKWMYNYQSGPINHFLVNTTGLFTLQNAPQWLGGTSLTLPAIAAMEVWWGLGYHTIFFLAGLAAIPKDLPEAARIDGANEWQMFWHVTFPRLMPIMMILVVLRFGSAMAVIDEYLIFGGFNRDSPTYTWTMFMYDQAFKTGLWRQGFAAAIGMIGALAMMVVMVILIRIFRSKG